MLVCSATWASSLQHERTRVPAEVGRGCLRQGDLRWHGQGELVLPAWLPSAGPVPSLNIKLACLIINFKSNLFFFITIPQCNQLGRWSYLMRALVQRFRVSPAARLNQNHP